MGLLDWFFRDKEQKQQNKANLALAKYQAQANEEFYNKYSSPQALMRQFSEAGLNPNLVYGSAGSGQGNVPSFTSPSVERYMSGSEKLSTALSSIAQVAGVATNVYQAAASKEAAEQSSIKTLQDVLNLTRDKGDMRLRNTLFDFPLYDPDYLSRFGKNRTNKIWNQLTLGRNFSPFLTEYSKMYRSSELNKLSVPLLENAANYGLYYNGNGGLNYSTYFGIPAMKTRNGLNSLRYRLTNELGNMGNYGKLIIGLVNALF